MWVLPLGWGDPLGKSTAIHSSILDWRILWTEEPGGLQSMGPQRVRHDWATKQQQLYYARALQTASSKTLRTSGGAGWVTDSISQMGTLRLRQLADLSKLGASRARIQSQSTWLLPNSTSLLGVDKPLSEWAGSWSHVLRGCAFLSDLGRGWAAGVSEAHSCSQHDRGPPGGV